MRKPLAINYKYILVVSASDANTATIEQSLNESYRLHFSKTRSDAEKFLHKYHSKIFCIIMDTTLIGEMATKMIAEWYRDLRYQLLPLIALYNEGDEKMRLNIVQSGTITFLSCPIKEKFLQEYVSSIDRRIKYSETRIRETFEDTVKTAKNKLITVANGINCGVLFLKENGTETFFEFANKKAIEFFGNIRFDDLLSKFSNDDTAKIIKALNLAKADYTVHTALVKTMIDDEERIFEFLFNQIENLDDDGSHKFVLCIVDRTFREKVVLANQRNQEMLTSILDNIKGGICVFRVEKDDIVREYVSKGIFKMAGYENDEKDLIRKILPVETQLLLTKKCLDIANDIMDGQNSDTFNMQSRIITKDFQKRHIAINVSVYRKDENTINIRALVFDNTDEYNYAQKLKHFSEYDYETNLFNNTKFVDATEKLFRSNEDKSYRLILIRIYRFDEIRSFFGKEKANELLKVVSDGIRTIGKGMLKGRVDSKDFAVSFKSDRVKENDFIAQLDKYVKENFTIYQVKLYYGIYNVEDVYESIDTLLIQTKFAVKEIEGNAIKNKIYCDYKMKNRIIENDNISNEMKKALEKNEFEVFLQPVFDLKSRKIVSAEALTRWHHPKRGYIPPGEYVPIFEENGFIVNIDMFVWESVCKIIRNWLDKGLNAVPISMNVSRIDLFSIDFYKVITGLVEKYKVPIEYIRLEITESAFVLNENSVIEIVDKLRDYGFKILMDDFGSGYSSLNSLKFINVDILKIDMELVKGIEESIRQADILKSVINLGQTLNLDLICEGVETEKQAEFVEANGCKKAQGWLFSKAIPVSDFNDKMENN